MREENIVDIERKAMLHLDVIREQKGLSEKEFGEAAFPDAVNPRQKVNALRKARGTKGEPLRVRLGDFCAMCVALKKHPAEELLKIWTVAKPEDEDQKSEASEG
jgi:hypothetical protein